jgi:hypothetical protein
MKEGRYLYYKIRYLDMLDIYTYKVMVSFNVGSLVLHNSNKFYILMSIHSLYYLQLCPFIDNN